MAILWVVTLIDYSEVFPKSIFSDGVQNVDLSNSLIEGRNTKLANQQKLRQTTMLIIHFAKDHKMMPHNVDTKSYNAIIILVFKCLKNAV